MAARHAGLKATLRDLAEQLDPSLQQPFVTIDREPWPRELAERGIFSYVDEQGVVHFTLRIDHPRGFHGEEGGPDDAF
jgi:hypothetical protein